MNQISKITHPKLSDIVPRKRLYGLLDKGLSRPVTWVTSPGGSGKTTLVKGWLDEKGARSIWYQIDEGDADIASFFYYMGLAAKKAAPRAKKPLPLFTPEYALGIPTFTRRWFESLYGRLKAPFFIVLDNFQDVPQSSGFHEMLYHGLESVPEGIHVVIISRAQPPESFSRLIANHRVFTLDWKGIRLNLDEARELIMGKGHAGLSEKAVSLVHKRTDGWAAGLVLIAEMSKKMDIDLRSADRVASDQLFDYFAHEVLRLMDEETRLFLLKTSFLSPHVRPETAGRLTGSENAGKILSRLSREHFFTTRHHDAEDTYQYHPLFKEFLLTQAEAVFGINNIREIHRSSAALLEGAGQPEHAVISYLKAGEYQEVSRLIIEQAPRLFAEGRSAVVREWIEALPADIVERTPYLLYWHGNCLMMISPVDSGKSFGKAFDGFNASGDRNGMMLSCAAAITLSIHIMEDFGALDRWIRELEALLQVDKSFPSPETEALVTVGLFCAMAMRQPHHTDISTWEERTFDLLMRDKLDPNSGFTAAVYLSVYHLWIGNFGRAMIVVSKLLELSRSPDVSDLVSLAVETTEVMLNLFLASFDRCISMVHEALEMAGKKGMHIWDTHLMDHGAAAALSAGYLEEADQLLGMFEQNIKYARLFDKAYYYYLVAWRALLRGDPEGAYHNHKLALQLVTDSGYIFAQPVVELLMAEILYDRADEAGAEEHLSRAYEISVGMKSRLLEYMCRLAEARMQFDRKREEEGLGLLQAAMTIGRENGFFTFMAWRPRLMSKLCMKALESEIEVEYVRELIRKRNLVPADPPIHLENWPWPVRIYTLGEFEILIGDKPLVFEGKAQKMPVMMLRTLIAYGGRDVHEEKMCDALWPDADGDSAHKSFDTTLHRLRKLLGIEGALSLKGGCLSLEKRFCWVDAYALERLLDDIDSRLGERDKVKSFQQAVQLAEKALSFYKGPFLPDMREDAPALSMSERLRSRLLGMLLKLGRSLQSEGLWDEAAGFLVKGIEIDRLAEEFYQELIICYKKLGQENLAVQAYNKCRSELAAGLGLAPSTKTEEIHAGLRRRT